LPTGTHGLYNPTKHIVACASHVELLGNTDSTGTSNATETVRQAPVAPVVAKAPPLAEVKGEEWYDLALNKPGQGVRERAEFEKKELQQKTSKLFTFIAKAVDMKTDERAWRVGANGEEKVGSDLDAFAGKHGFRVLHSVPVGNRGSDIDHVLLGSSGVYTVNTKTHPGKQVWCQGDTMKINYGQKVDYVRDSRHEAERASKLLTKRLGWTPSVMGLVVVLTGTEVTNLKVERQPKDWVHVIGRSDLISWLSRQPSVLSETQVAEIYEVARRNTTWLT
jgi:hypothetical protein